MEHNAASLSLSGRGCTPFRRSLHELFEQVSACTANRKSYSDLRQHICFLICWAIHAERLKLETRSNKLETYAAEYF